MTWWPPPLGVLKLNFDGSYIREEHRVGFGCVIRDHDGTVIRSYSGQIGTTNTNEEEISSMLIGCRELKLLYAFNSIMEGDSHPTLPWGSSPGDYPWRFARLRR